MMRDLQGSGGSHYLLMLGTNVNSLMTVKLCRNGPEPLENFVDCDIIYRGKHWAYRETIPCIYNVKKCPAIFSLFLVRIMWFFCLYFQHCLLSGQRPAYCLPTRSLLSPPFRAEGHNFLCRGLPESHTRLYSTRNKRKYISVAREGGRRKGGKEERRKGGKEGPGTRDLGPLPMSQRCSTEFIQFQ